MKFTKYNNPAKKRKRVNKSYTDRCIDQLIGMLIDKKLGYETPVSIYAVGPDKIADNK